MMRIMKSGAYLIMLVAIFAITTRTDDVLACGLSNYNCLFSELITLSIAILALYLASKLL